MYETVAGSPYTPPLPLDSRSAWYTHKNIYTFLNVHNHIFSFYRTFFSLLSRGGGGLGPKPPLCLRP